MERLCKNAGREVQRTVNCTSLVNDRFFSPPSLLRGKTLMSGLKERDLSRETEQGMISFIPRHCTQRIVEDVLSEGFDIDCE